MTLKKKPLSRDYETFSSTSDPADGSTKSPSDTSRRSVGLKAQRLASRVLWDDSNANRSPRPASPAMGAPEEAYSREEYPSDPPPIYTPSETTADASSTPPSPVMSRSQPVGEPRSPVDPVAYPTIHEEAEEQSPAAEAYASSPLLERAQTSSEDQPRRCGRWSRDAHKDGRRRFRKACWFSCALAICLWLMLPALLDDRAGTRGPHWHHRPDDKDLDSSPIPAWPIPRREYRQHETSSSISGTFKLYDLLDLSTTSGSININVEPQPGNKTAVMNIRAQSGSVRIQMGKGILPWLPSSDENNRTFETSISTQSGSVSGSIVAGNGGATTIETTSGSIRLTVHVLDLGPKGKTSRLETVSGSGSQTLTVASSSSHDLRNLEAMHLVKSSASLRVDYPRRWLGKLHMKSMGSGSMRASGSGLEFAEDGNREKYAWRGSGDLNEVELVLQGSGSARFSC